MLQLQCYCVTDVSMMAPFLIFLCTIDYMPVGDVIEKHLVSVCAQLAEAHSPLLSL